MIKGWSSLFFCLCSYDSLITQLPLVAPSNYCILCSSCVVKISISCPTLVNINLNSSFFLD